nr:protein phosphatase 2C domain-containing protein [Thermochromatium tepidum]
MALSDSSGLLDDYAALQRRNPRDLRATLLLAAVGRFHVFWWQVGDEAIVAQTHAGLRSLSDSSSAKGEFANQTMFIDTARVSLPALWVAHDLTSALGCALACRSAALALPAARAAELESRPQPASPPATLLRLFRQGT